MKKILLFLLLFINILSFSEFNDKAQLKLAINKGNKGAEHILFHVLNDEVCSCNND